MTDRPRKLPTRATLVIWGARALTLGEKVVFYHDWALDQDGPDGTYISHQSMELRLGGALTAATVSKIRQRLKRLTLHEPIRRPDAHNLGWVSTLPPQFVPRSFRDIPGLAVALDGYLAQLACWSQGASPGSPDTLDATVHGAQTPESNLGAAALGGRGGVPSRPLKRETPLPSAVSSTAEKPEKGEGARAPKEKGGHDLRAPEIVRAEGWALIRLQKGERLTPEERHLVETWLARQGASPSRFADRIRNLAKSA